MQLPVIPGDKANHLIYGAVIAAVGRALALPALSWLQTRYGLHPLIGPATVGLLLAVLAGAAKELWDRRSNRLAVAAGQAPAHEVSRADMLYTWAGGLAVWAMPHAWAFN